MEDVEPRGNASFPQLYLDSGIFYLKSPLLALLVIIALLLAIARLMIIQSRYSRSALCLFIPYSIWVCFATVLNASIWYLN